MKAFFDEVSVETSAWITKRYSTSFSMGIRLLDKELRGPIYAIYGFTRVADEIVDSFDGFAQEELLSSYKKDTYKALESGISSNPVLNAFQKIVNKYSIGLDLIENFFHSMEMDLNDDLKYNQELYERYILGSAQVVGLMCLRVFCLGDDAEYERLKATAMSLGSAFQKVNFLRDANYDFLELNRTYFPNVDFNSIKSHEINAIFDDIQLDFDEGLKGIKQLPDSSRFGVFLAYRYYQKLFLKIKKKSGEKFLDERVRIANYQKANILLRSLVRYQINYY